MMSEAPEVDKAVDRTYLKIKAENKDLRAENERLRKALKAILNIHVDDPWGAIAYAQNIAEATLSEARGEGV